MGEYEKSVKVDILGYVSRLPVETEFTLPLLRQMLKNAGIIASPSHIGGTVGQNKPRCVEEIKTYNSLRFVTRKHDCGNCMYGKDFGRQSDLCPNSDVINNT